MLVAGDAAKNVDVESQALFAAFKEMGIMLDDLDGVYTHFDRKKLRKIKRWFFRHEYGKCDKRILTSKGKLPFAGGLLFLCVKMPK